MLLPVYIIYPIYLLDMDPQLLLIQIFLSLTSYLTESTTDNNIKPQTTNIDIMENGTNLRNTTTNGDCPNHYYHSCNIGYHGSNYTGGYCEASTEVI